MGKTALVVVVRHPSSSSPPPPPSSSSSSSSSPSSSSWPVARRRRRRPLLPHVVECDLVLNEFIAFFSSPATLPRVGRRDLPAAAPLRPRLVLPLDRHGKVSREISPQIATMARLPHGHASGRHGSGASFARSRVVVRQHGKRLNRSRPRERRRRQRRRRRIVEDGGSRRLL